MIFLGVIATHCMILLTRSSQVLCERYNNSNMTMHYFNTLKDMMRPRWTTVKWLKQHFQITNLERNLVRLVSLKYMSARLLSRQLTREAVCKSHDYFSGLLLIYF